jgi:hypothetical protein
MHGRSEWSRRAERTRFGDTEVPRSFKLDSPAFAILYHVAILIPGEKRCPECVVGA